jgi:hypothetical protein
LRYSKKHDRFDSRQPTTLSIIYAQLELRFGLIRATTPKYSKYEFKAEPQYFVAHQIDNSAVAKAIQQTAIKAATWYHIDVDEAAQRSSGTRMDVITKLNDWHDRGIIEMKTSGVMHVYRIEKSLPETEDELNDIADKLFSQMQEREQADLKRTQDVVALATSSSCISRGLATYFGDTSKELPVECGHCTWCETHQPQVLGKQAYKETKRSHIQHILQAIPERDDPRFLARVAFGITSPKITAAKLQYKTDLYASLGTHNFMVRSSFPLIFMIRVMITINFNADLYLGFTQGI